MNEIEFNTAVDLAKKEIKRLSNEANDTYQICPEKTLIHELGWIFFYNSREYILTGNFSSALAGNGPFLVMKNGSIHHLGTSESWLKNIKNISN